MKTHKQNSLRSIRGEDTKITTNLNYVETVVRNENAEFERVHLLCHKVYIKDKDGKVRETKLGETYEANIRDGVLSFKQPLKFEDHE